MTLMKSLRATYPRTFGALGQWRRPVGVLNSIGDHTLFYGRALAGIPFATVHYRREVIRLVAEISMGAGTLAMIGGTVVIVGFLTLAAGGTLAVQGYSSLGNIGIEALTGYPADEFTSRRDGFTPLPPRYTSGVLAKYVKLVGSAAIGAVCG